MKKFLITFTVLLSISQILCMDKPRVKRKRPKPNFSKLIETKRVKVGLFQKEFETFKKVLQEDKSLVGYHNEKKQNILHMIISNHYKENFSSKSVGDFEQRLSYCLSYMKKHNILETCINQRDVEGNTPLHYSLLYKNIISFNVLLQHDAKVDVQNNKLQTPLHIAVINSNEYAIKKLITSNANVSIKDDLNNTPLFNLALTAGHLKNYSSSDKYKQALQCFKVFIRHYPINIVEHYNVFESLLKDAQLDALSWLYYYQPDLSLININHRLKQLDAVKKLNDKQKAEKNHLSLKGKKIQDLLSCINDEDVKKMAMYGIFFKYNQEGWIQYALKKHDVKNTYDLQCKREIGLQKYKVLRPKSKNYIKINK